jgi:hypothetical protein
LKLKTGYFILSPVFLLEKQRAEIMWKSKIMSVNRVILYEKLRIGMKYLLQSSLLLSSFRCCYSTGFSIMWLILLHSPSLCVCVFFFFFREVHHMCVLLGYGADAICPYLVFEISRALRNEEVLDATFTDDVLYKVSLNMDT